MNQTLKAMNITVQGSSFPTHQGNPPDYRGVPFSLTEEFVSVYRMHSLLPDTIAVRRMDNGKTAFIVNRLTLNSQQRGSLIR